MSLIRGCQIYSVWKGVKEKNVGLHRHCSCIAFLTSFFCSAAVQQGPECLQRAAGFLCLSLSKTQPCVTTTPPVLPPPLSCTCADSTPSPSGTLRSQIRWYTDLLRAYQHVWYNFKFHFSSDFPKVSKLLTKSASAQRTVEGEPSCPSGAARLTSWCVLQSAPCCAPTSLALRTAARSTPPPPPPPSALQAGKDPLRSQSSARHLMDSTLERKRKHSPASPAHTTTPASLSPASASSGQKKAPSPLKTWTWGSALCPPHPWHAALSKDSGRRERCHRGASWNLLHPTPGWCERPHWRSTQTTPSGWCPGRSYRRSWSPGIRGTSCRSYGQAVWISRALWAPPHLICLHLNRFVQWYSSKTGH